MKLFLALTFFAMSAQATLNSVAPTIPRWLWLPGPPQIEAMSAQEVVIAGTREDLELELSALRCSSEIRCELNPDAVPCRADVTLCVPENFRNDLGATYAQAGPNCFSTALRGAGLTTSLTGVDAPEMKAFARAFCQEVQEPQTFDIGIYHAPNSDGASAFAPSTLWIHGFIHLSPGFVLEKQGVDYWGATPVTLRGFSIMDHRVRISPECRRFSPDPEVCANRLIYLRCRSPEFPDKLARALNRMNEVADILLRQKAISASDLTLWDQAYQDIHRALLGENLESALNDYVQEKLASLRKQREFFR
ncbi:MAG: hypothetical protein KF767_11310 [Bdellovibrionaceae bacterium]|nr:hypothetical protein [Pseudobdellovibrionaceae bacterium]